MTNLRYEIYESNNGTVTMFVLDASGNPVWAHGGYEYAPESLLQDIEALEKNNDVSGWDGNGMYDGMCFESWKDRGISLQKHYNDVTFDCWTCLIADSDGIYPENMCTVATEIFVKQEMEER